MNATNESTYLTQRTSGTPVRSSSKNNNHHRAGLKICCALILFVAFASSYKYVQERGVSSEPSEHNDALVMKMLPFKNKHKHKNKKKTNKNHDSMMNECLEDTMYTKKTAKTLYEMPFAALFKDTKGEKKFEASGITKRKDDPFYYAICDNSWAISKIAPNLAHFSSENIMIGDPNREEEDSGYEAIFEHNNTFYVIRESVEHFNETSESNSAYHAIIEELSLDEDDYEVKAQCSCEFEFEGDSKGFEGACGLEGTNGDFFVLGLCEGNHCSETRKHEKGNGQVVLMAKEECLWRTIKTINIPATAFFADYSDISIRPDGKVAIVSQEDSAVWIGKLLGVNGGKLDPDLVKFDDEVGEVFNFPKSNNCQTVYCNVEGVTFINDGMLMVVSDQMKGKGKQPFHCMEKDQSVHAFILP